ncbi:very short patch repair endonuclease [Zafaria sp. Z1313]|uniref:very short patch repair endonuclease n=1 Tax=unclassified Zafaria TaxID=2828765 RepID=UPI002E785BFD|nr:very short patch repair endonuclease [Zafaria sp. J156]MEE1622553.1 very short patch repair endonuclease [Zafaria sp. J156]
MDPLTPAERSAMMARIKGSNTAPELAVRRIAHAAGYRFRLHGAISRTARGAAARTAPDVRLRGGRLPGRPDLVFASRHKVVLVHGCFWHRHDCPAGLRTPGTNTAFWVDKRLRNVERDARQLEQLRALGWEPLIVWECQLKDPEAVLRELAAFLG